MGWDFHRHTCKYGHLWVWELVQIGANWNCKFESCTLTEARHICMYVRSYIGAEATHTWLCIMGWGFDRHTCKYGYLWQLICLAFRVWELVQMGRLQMGAIWNCNYWLESDFESCTLTQVRHICKELYRCGGSSYKGVCYYWHCAVGNNIICALGDITQPLGSIFFNISMPWPLYYHNR